MTDEMTPAVGMPGGPPGTGGAADPAGAGPHGGPAGEPGQVDVAVVEAERLAGQLGSELAALEAALRRVEDGSYGRCETCGEDIPDEVLAEAPAATRCRQHGAAG